jgi:hypothetical protein
MPFRDPAHARFSLRKTHGHRPRDRARLKIYPQPPAWTLPTKHPLKHPASYNSPATARQPQLAKSATVVGRAAADDWRVSLKPPGPLIAMPRT